MMVSSNHDLRGKKRRDEKGNAVVVINDIRFKDRQNIDWHAVEEYLYEYVGENVEILKMIV